MSENDETVTTEEEPMIVYREPYTEDGVQMYKEHRVPVSEWVEYEKENGL